VSPVVPYRPLGGVERPRSSVRDCIKDDARAKGNGGREMGESNLNNSNRLIYFDMTKCCNRAPVRYNSGSPTRPRRVFVRTARVVFAFRDSNKGIAGRREQTPNRRTYINPEARNAGIRTIFWIPVSEDCRPEYRSPKPPGKTVLYLLTKRLEMISLKRYCHRGRMSRPSKTQDSLVQG
jgi:hypothetical protein